MQSISNKHIVLCAPVPPPVGGIANWTQTVCRYLEVENNIDFDLLDIAPSANAPGRRNVFVRLLDGVRTTTGSLLKIKKLLKQHDPVDCVHITTSGGLAFARDLALSRYLSHRGVRCVVHFHFGRTPDVLKSRSLEGIMLRSLLKTDAVIICIDGPTFNSLKSNSSSCRAVYQIANPIDVDVIRKYQKDEEIRRDRNLLFVGHVNADKGILDLLDAWQELSLDFKDWTLCVVGPCADKQLEEKIRSANRVLYCGEVSHEKALAMIAESSLLVLPSHTEGFPMVILEAMTLATPVLASEVGAIPSMLGDGRGVLVEPGAPAALSEKLRATLNNLDDLAVMGLSSKKYAEENYDIGVVLREYEKVWFGENE